MQSQSEENYLKAIYYIGHQETGKVTITSLARLLGNNPASIVDMLKKMTERKLVKYNKDKGVRLTDAGLKSAIMTIRKHRLWEKFLLEKLKYKWDEVHEIAEQLEHVHDEQLADKLDAFLGHPKFDPHGESIPNAKGQITNLPELTLSHGEPGKEYTVVSVKNTSGDFLRYMQKLGIGIATRLKIAERIEFDGSVVIILDIGQEVTLSKKMAENIHIAV